jgi:hypothetical protein
MKIIGGSNNFPPLGGPPGLGGKPGKPERIKIDAKCTVCGSLYDFGKLEVLQEEDGATLMYIKCSVCHSAALSIIALGAFGVKVASALTDLERDEVMFFQEEDFIKSSEVLQLHEDLEKQDNWFKSL